MKSQINQFVHKYTATYKMLTFSFRLTFDLSYCTSPLSYYYHISGWASSARHWQPSGAAYDAVDWRDWASSSRVGPMAGLVKSLSPPHHETSSCAYDLDSHSGKGQRYTMLRLIICITVSLLGTWLVHSVVLVGLVTKCYSILHQGCMR